MTSEDEEFLISQAKIIREYLEKKQTPGEKTDELVRSWINNYAAKLRGVYESKKISRDTEET